MPLTKAQIKHIKQLTNKKNCEESQLFKAEGAKCVQDLINGGAVLAELYVIEKYFSLFPEATIVADYVMEQTTSLNNAQGVLALFELPILNTPASLRNTVSLVLDGVQDPGNMGTIIRIADWVGIQHIFASSECAFAYAPKVVQASMGSIARVRVNSCDIFNLIMENKSINSYAAVLKGNNLYEMKPIQEGFIVLGSEGKGINNELLKLCNKHITIPGAGHAESLNVAISAGIICSYLVH
jgi:RNA methyltransferase, TrmH family